MTTTETKFEAKPVAAICAGLLRDLNTGGKEWAVVRTSYRSQVWGFYATRALAVAACRRWKSREIVTR